MKIVIINATQLVGSLVSLTYIIMHQCIEQNMDGYTDVSIENLVGKCVRTQSE